MELLVTVKNPKFVSGNDKGWQAEGYDACRAESTSASTHMEWCIKDPKQIKVLRVTPVRCDISDNEDEEEALRRHAEALEKNIRLQQTQVQPPYYIYIYIYIYILLTSCILH